MERGANLMASIEEGCSAPRQHVCVDPAGSINRFRNRAIVVAGDYDRISICVDAADDANMSAATAPHHSDSPDLGARHARTVACIGAGKISAARVTGALEDQVHESAAPQTGSSGRVDADVFARPRDQRVAGGATIG